MRVPLFSLWGKTLLALLTGSSSAWSQEPPPVSPEVEFCISGGAPLVGEPQLDSRGRLYFVTLDGYLHAFEADGRYRWSYTVQGAPTGGALLRADERAILLATSERLFYVIDESGVLQSQQRLVSPQESEFRALQQNALGFVGRDNYFYSITARGGARYRVRLPEIPSGQWEAHSEEQIWIPVPSGVLRLQAAQKLQKIELPHAIEQLELEERELLALGGSQIYHIDLSGNLFHQQRAHDLVQGSEARALFLDHHRFIWSSSQGEKSFQLPADAQKSGSPAVSAQQVLIPLQDGTLWLQPWSGEARRVQVSRSALLQPLVSAQNSRWIIPDQQGVICSVFLE